MQGSPTFGIFPERKFTPLTMKNTVMRADQHTKRSTGNMMSNKTDSLIFNKSSEKKVKSMYMLNES